MPVPASITMKKRGASKIAPPPIPGIYQPDVPEYRIHVTVPGRTPYVSYTPLTHYYAKFEVDALKEAFANAMNAPTKTDASSDVKLVSRGFEFGDYADPKSPYIEGRGNTGRLHMIGLVERAWELYHKRKARRKGGR